MNVYHLFRILQSTRNFLPTNFEMKDFGEYFYFLQDNRDRNKVYCSFFQKAYIKNILKRLEMQNYAPGETPILKGNVINWLHQLIGTSWPIIISTTDLNRFFVLVFVLMGEYCIIPLPLFALLFWSKDGGRRSKLHWISYCTNYLSSASFPKIIKPKILDRAVKYNTLKWKLFDA